MSKSNSHLQAASPNKFDAKSISIPESHKPEYLSAAQDWFRLGLNVIPIVPGTKKTAVKWDPWLLDLSELKIYRYWKKHPNHELGFIVGPDLIVFDADTQQSLARLCEIEKTFGVSPALSVKTRHGEHHYFRLAKGILAKSDSHSSEKHPDRIDVKTGRALIVLPPSGGKEVIDND
jgi:hypothetical protein